jgi:hypothetical protein
MAQVIEYMVPISYWVGRSSRKARLWIDRSKAAERHNISDGARLHAALLREALAFSVSLNDSGRGEASVSEDAEAIEAKFREVLNAVEVTDADGHGVVFYTEWP